MSVKIAPGLFSDYRISEKCRASIVIPVRDEAENIAATLRAFTGQVDAAGKPLDFQTFEILILINNCSDDSAEIIKKFRRENPRLNLHSTEIELPAENANIGFARRVLMNAAYERLSRNAAGVIMTTDGDTIVAVDWIAANLREIEMGAEAVGGRIFISGAELEKMNRLCRETHLRDEEYRLLAAEIESLIDELPFDRAPRHHQHFNASFACATGIYRKAGGVPDVKFLEDCAFFESLQRIDARFRHSPDVKVYTSSRHVGRSEVGLSFQLNLWKNLNEAGEDFLVESAEAIIERFAAKRDLRKIWRESANGNSIDANELNLAAARVFILPEFIAGELKKRQPFGAFYENLMRRQHRVGDWARRFPPVALDIALNDLKIITQKITVEKAWQNAADAANG